MLLDARTLYFEMFATSVVLGLAELLFFLRRREHVSVGWWAAANLGGALGMLLVGLRAFIAPFWSIAVGNALAVGALAVAWFGIRVYARRSLPVWRTATLIVALLAALAIPSPLSASLAARIVLVGLAMAGLELAIAATSLSVARREASVAAAICAALMLLCAVVNIVRGVEVALHGAGPDYMGHNAMHALTIFLLVPAFAGWNMCLMMMSTERVHRSLAHAARVDGLTGALNREGFRELAEKRLRQAQLTHQPLSLALIDLDHFKTINDRGGHAAGDDVLCRFARLAHALLRPADVLGRYGGDEFAVVLPGADADQAELIAARLCQRFSEATRELIPGVQPTLSIGVATLEPRMTLDTLLSLADVALYRAKASGRDGVALVRDLQDGDIGAPLPVVKAPDAARAEALLFD